MVIADRLGPRDLLDELPPHVEVIDAAKIPYGRAMAQEAINSALIEHAKAGKAVVRLKGGDPYVFGRGMEEAEALAAAGVLVTVVPGISSAISVPGAAGIPVTHRGVAHEFTVVSGHVAPGDPRSLVDWDALARLRGTLVLLMAVERIGAIAESLVAAWPGRRHPGRRRPGGHHGRAAQGRRHAGDRRAHGRRRRRTPARRHRHRRRRRRRRRVREHVRGRSARNRPSGDRPWLTSPRSTTPPTPA